MVKMARRFLKSTVCRNLWRMEQIRNQVFARSGHEEELLLLSGIPFVNAADFSQSTWAYNMQDV